MTSVLVSFPNTGWVRRELLQTVEFLRMDSRHKIRTIKPIHRPYENNLHHIVRDFLRGGEDYWLNIDADNPPMQNPLDLVELDKDIIGLPTPVFHRTGEENPGDRFWYWNAYRWDDAEQAFREWQPQQGLQRVDAVGTGCVLYARRVFEDKAMQEGPFIRVLNHDGTVDMGNDLAFCRRATARGHEIWAHFGYPCRHIHEIDLVEMIEAVGAYGGH